MDQECAFEEKLLAFLLWLVLQGSLKAGTHGVSFSIAAKLEVMKGGQTLAGG